MATYQDYIYGDRGFDADLISTEGIGTVEVVTRFTNGTSFVFSRFFFSQEGLCIKHESVGPWIGYPPGGPFSEFPMKRLTLLSYDDNRRLSMQEVRDIKTGKLLGETMFSYRDDLLERSTRNISFETGDPKDVVETRFEYDKEGNLQNEVSFSYKKGRSQSGTKFERRGGKVIRKTVSNYMEEEYNNIDELIEDTSIYYNDNDQLIEAITKCNTGDEWIDTFTYETPTTINIKQQQRATNGVREFKNEYIYFKNGLISRRIQEFETQRFETEYIYKGH
jgi:hypothetical protein